MPSITLNKPSISDEVICTDVAELFVDDSGIIYLSFPVPSTPVNLSQAKEILRTRKTLQPTGEKQLILVDLRSNPKPDREARDFAKSDQMNEVTKGMAILVANPLSRMLGNFFLGLNRGKYAVRIFKNKEQASGWLLALK